MKWIKMTIWENWACTLHLNLLVEPPFKGLIFVLKKIVFGANTNIRQVFKHGKQRLNATGVLLFKFIINFMFCLKSTGSKGQWKV